MLCGCKQQYAELVCGLSRHAQEEEGFGQGPKPSQQPGQHDDSGGSSSEDTLSSSCSSDDSEHSSNEDAAVTSSAVTVICEKVTWQRQSSSTASTYAYAYR